jgi:hypothetical protein
MIIIGSGALLTIGLLNLLVQAIRIVFSLLKIAFYLIQIAVCLVVLVVCSVGLVIQYVMRWGKPKPVITVNISLDGEDVPTIDLPPNGFHRVQG